jgi:transcriptional regulator with XRE-family HTH domain
MMQTATPSAQIGPLLREWRTRRRLSQLDLALEAGVSQRHLSFMESGRSAPSREMVEMLAETMDVPLRERNALLLAAGFAPAYAERRLDDPAMTRARETIGQLLKAHEPNPALAVDRHWRMVMRNAALEPMLMLVADRSLIEGEFNVLRASLHPQGLAPHILNLREWRDHLLHRIRRQLEASSDAGLVELERELAAYPVPPLAPRAQPEPNLIAVPLRLKAGEMVLSFISTITVFGTPVDITLSELALETFFPADEQTAAMLRAMGSA